MVLATKYEPWRATFIRAVGMDSANLARRWAGWIYGLGLQGRYGRGQDIQLYNTDKIWRYIRSVAERG